ncbi:hypothetical protein B0H19DRAFT_1080326 [Mycena capillaripes]|nr:hypothetical protein B0H19DRAFT_1080326 [Mycena capillaripes]
MNTFMMRFNAVYAEHSGFRFRTTDTGHRTLGICGTETAADIRSLQYSLMPAAKKAIRDWLNRLNGRLPSPKKAIKRVGAIALSPVKARPQKKHRHEDPADDRSSIFLQEPEFGTANIEDEDVFLDNTDPPTQYHEFHQGSMPEHPTAAPLAFKLKGRLAMNSECSSESPHHDDDHASIQTFPPPHAPSLLAGSDDYDLNSEIVPPELDELCHRRKPSMAALGTKQILAVAPDITSANAALMDIELVLRGPSRGKSGGYIAPDFSPWVRVRMEGICSHLAQYSNPNSVTYGQWGLSARQAAIGAGRDEYCARRFASLSREYIASRKVLPINPYGDWNQTMLADEDLANDVREHLQELGKFITADKLVDYLSREDVMDKHGLDRKISVRTARRYLNDLGYRFKTEKKGQFSDGHERDDVVYYREEVYLPALKGFQDRSCVFEADGSVITPTLPAGVRRTVIWKGDGASYMVADYFSADFGWLRTRDSRPIARRSMRPGKNRDGYFSAADIEEQAIAACTTVNERWPEYDHVFVYDNATTHRKRSAGALPARAMPKSISGTRKGEKNKNPDPNFLVPVNKRNDDGSLMYDMTGASFADGTVQELYFSSDAPKHAGKFKGMELLLEERRQKGDLGDISADVLKKKNAECKSFKCAHRFADAYRHGLDGAQAAWAARKYKGHRILPPEFRKEMEASMYMV